VESGPRKRKRDFSLRRPTLSQERKRKKKSACFVRNDGQWLCHPGRRRPATYGMTVMLVTGWISIHWAWKVSWT
jgi:hypothetical protein